MNNINDVSDDPHQWLEELLPWFANGTLEETERARVEHHLAKCAACRGQLASEISLRNAVAGLPITSDLRWDRLRECLTVTSPRRAGRGNRAPWSRRTALGRALVRPGKTGWIIGAQTAALVFVVSATMPGDRSPPLDAERGQYATLSSAPVTAAGNIIVMFDPDTTERDMRGVLMAARARIISGPTASGGYVLQVADDARGAILTTLRADKNVELAEPIEGSTPR